MPDRIQNESRHVDLGDGTFAPQVVIKAAPGAGALNVTPGAPAASNILVGVLSHAITTAATTLMTVPAGRTWTGMVVVTCTTSVAAASATAGQARAVVTTAGVGVVPAAGSVLAAEARAGANAATGTVGSSNSVTQSIPLTVVAPAGNAVTVQVASTISTGVVDVSASGALA